MFATIMGKSLDFIKSLSA